MSCMCAVGFPRSVPCISSLNILPPRGHAVLQLLLCPPGQTNSLAGWWANHHFPKKLKVKDTPSEHSREGDT